MWQSTVGIDVEDGKATSFCFASIVTDKTHCATQRLRGCDHAPVHLNTDV